MPDYHLLELESPVHAADRVDTLLHDLSGAIDNLQGCAQVYQKIWDRIVIDVAKGRTEEIHAEHPKLLAAFHRSLKLLKVVAFYTQPLRELGFSNTPAPEAMQSDIANMERLKAEVFDRWKSAEDLVDLAARDYPLPTARLEEIGPHLQPPQSWYDEEGKPF